MSRGVKAKTGGARRDRVFDIAVGARIRARRQKKEFTQTELAELIGVTGGQLSRYEAGETTCEPATLSLLAGALGCKPGAFIDGLEVEK